MLNLAVNSPNILALTIAFFQLSNLFKQAIIVMCSSFHHVNFAVILFFWVSHLLD